MTLSNLTILTITAITTIVSSSANPNSNGTKLRIITAVSPPFVTKDSGQLIGFIPEFVAAIATVAGFTYDLVVQEDGAFGVLQSDGSWNGMVGCLITGSVDLIAADLTLTAARNEFIDFTTPFLSTQLRILVNTQSGTNNISYLVEKDTSYQQFLQTSTVAKYQAIWQNIKANYGFVSSVQEGINKVFEGGFSFVASIPQLNSYLKANGEVANLRLSPDIILSQFFAFGVQQGSPLRNRISIAISKINENSQLKDLLDKYNLSV